MSQQSRRAVFLDRDGVLNRAIVTNGTPHPPATLAELEIVPDAFKALETLKAAGFVLIGVTNQPDVARGTQRREVVDAINDRLLAVLPLREILVCDHDDHDGCGCRKPQPGLLIQAAAKYGIDLSSSVIIGDRWKDIETGRRAGCTTVLIGCGYEEMRPDIVADSTVRSLTEAVAWIFQHSHVAGKTA